MAEEIKYYKLGGIASSFFDPSQSKEDNKKLVNQEVKALDPTIRVKKSLRAGGIIPATKGEFDAYNKQHKKLKEEALAAANTKTGEADVKVTKSAEAKIKKAEEEAQAAKEEAAEALNNAESFKSDSEEKQKQIEFLEAKLKENNIELETEED